MSLKGIDVLVLDMLNCIPSWKRSAEIHSEWANPNSLLPKKLRNNTLSKLLELPTTFSIER